jgi:hypothetical protein
MLVVAAVATATVSCGREPTGFGLPGTASAVLDLSPLFQTTSSGGGDAVATVTMLVYLVNTALPAGAPGRRQLIATSTYSANDARITQTPGQYTVSVTFPLYSASSVYEIEGGAFDAAGLRLFAVAPAQFTQAQALSGTATASVSTEYVGPGATATALTISLRSITVPRGQSVTVTATATTANGGAVSVAPIRWESSNTAVFTVPDAKVGRVVGVGAGTAQLRAYIQGTSVQDAIPVTVFVVTGGSGGLLQGRP